MSQPWICPRCEKVNAPTLMQCFCKPLQGTETVTFPAGVPSQIIKEIDNKFNVNWPNTPPTCVNQVPSGCQTPITDIEL